MIRLSRPVLLSSAIVLDADIGDWSFWNRQAKREAEALLEQLRDIRK